LTLNDKSRKKAKKGKEDEQKEKRKKISHRELGPSSFGAFEAARVKPN